MIHSNRIGTAYGGSSAWIGANRSGRAWSPADLGKLEWLFDAQDHLAAYDDGDAVSGTFDDFGPNGYTMDVGGSPTCEIVDGVRYFDTKADGYLDSNRHTFGSSAISLFAAAGQQWSVLTAQRVPAAGGGYYIAMVQAGTGSGDWQWAVRYDPSGSIRPGGIVRGGGVTGSGLALNDGGLHLTHYVWDGSTLSLRVNGAASTSYNMTIGAAAEQAAAYFVIGALNDTGAVPAQNHQVGLAAITSGTLTAAERQLFEGWAAWRMEASGLLPADHPYRHGRP